MFATFQTNLLCISSEKQIAFLCLLPHSIRTFISSMPCLLDFNEANQVKIVWQRINFFLACTHFFIFLQNDMTYLFPLLEIHTLLKNSARMGCPTRHLSSWKFERFYVGGRMGKIYTCVYIFHLPNFLYSSISGLLAEKGGVDRNSTANKSCATPVNWEKNIKYGTSLVIYL